MSTGGNVMIPYERRQILLAELEKQDMVSLEAFGKALKGVSAVSYTHLFLYFIYEKY